MDKSLEELSEEEVKRLENSEWFNTINKTDNTIVLDYTGFPAILALHKNGETYQGILDKQSESYQEMVDTINNLIK